MSTVDVLIMSTVMWMLCYVTVMSGGFNYVYC